VVCRRGFEDARRRRQPARRAAPRAGDDTDDFLATGFVDDYLDAAQVVARISSLAAEFPTLCQLTTLPHMTSGYDGSVASLAGPASVQMLRITDDPTNHSRPGFLLICGTHAREWVNPLVAVVSFADPSPDPSATPPEERAVVEFPLTEIDDAGDYAAARASVDGIAFGGWTPIGAGLAKSAEELAGASHPKAVVLLSDGFENRDPTTADVLATFPPDIRVYTVALGGLADVPLLQDVAAQTGGQFYMSPTTIELHEIYNQIRSDVSDDGLVLNAVVGESGGDDDAASPHHAYVEAGAAKLIVCVSWGGKNRKSRLGVVDPFGRKVRDRDWGVQTTRGDGYLLLRIDRPAPGRWAICPERLDGPHVVAAFVRSPVRLQIKTGWERKDRARAPPSSRCGRRFPERPSPPSCPARLR